MHIKKYIFILVLIICGFLPSQAFATIPAGTLNSGLVGLWTFDGVDTNWNTNRVTDQSGNGNTANISLMSTTTSPRPGKIGQAMNINGSNQYVSVSDSSTIQNLWDGGGTISMWIYPRSCGPANNGYWFSKSAYYILLANNISGNACGVEFDVDFSGGSAKWRNTGTLPLNKWSHVTVVYNSDSTSNNPILYINGAVVSMPVVLSPSGTRNSEVGQAFQIGGNPSLTRVADSIIDDVRMYTRSLSASEVSQLYKNGQTNIGITQTNSLKNGLVGLWTFDGADMNWATGKAIDRSGYGNDAIFYVLSTTTSPTSGKIGQGVQIVDGSTQSITATSITVADNLQDFTWSTWAKIDSKLDNRALLTKNSAIDLRTATCGFQCTGLRMAVDLDTTDSVALTNDMATLIGTWIQVTVTYNGTTKITTLYVNGVETGGLGYNTHTTGVGTRVSDTNNFRIGNTQFSNGAFNGKLDEVRIYNRVLTTAEIAQLYKNGQVAVNKAPTAVAPSGLVGYWSFNGADINWATGKAIDRSGQGNDGTFLNIATTTGVAQGRVGQAVNFVTNGLPQYVSAGSPAVLDNMTTLTYSAWIKSTSWPLNGLGRIVVKDNGGSDTLGVNLQASAVSYQVLQIQGTVGNSVTTAEASSQNIAIVDYKTDWHHVAMTYDDATKVVKLYIDGVEASYQTHTTGSGTKSDDSAGVLLIGNSGYGTRQFYGPIDEVRIYNRVLSANEIMQLYKSSGSTLR